MSLPIPKNPQADWLYVFFDRDLGMDAAQGVARDIFNHGSLLEYSGVTFNPVDPSWFNSYTDQAGAQVMIDYCNHEEGFIYPRVKRELLYLKSPLIAFTWRGKADLKDFFLIGLTIKLGSTDPYEVWGGKDIFPSDRLEKVKAAESQIRRRVEENIELRNTRVWCNFCHRMCYLMLKGSAFHFDNEFELAGISGITASVCKSCNHYICGGCLLALSKMENARQVCPHCGKASWDNIITLHDNTT